MSELFEAKPDIYPTNKAKVNCAAAWISGNPKSAWGRRKTDVDLSTFTWEDFQEFLRNQLEHAEDRGMNATLRFEALKQGESQKIQDFEEVFNDALGELKILSSTRKDEEHWARTYFAKLRTSAQRAILSAGPVPKTIVEVTAAGHRMENLRHNQAEEREADRRNPGKHSRHTGSSSSHKKSDKTSSHSSSAFQAGDKRKPSDNPSRHRKRQHTDNSADRERQRKEGRCFNCNETGHMASQCPKKEATSKST